MAASLTVKPDAECIERLSSLGGDSVKKCYQCGTCSVACALSPLRNPFPRKEMMWAQWGLKGRLLSDPDVWLCYQCNDCTKSCPRGARPGDVLAAVRSYTIESFAFPRFMGRALAAPKALPILMVVPIVIFGTAALIQTRGDFSFVTSETLKFNDVFSHHFLVPFFTVGGVVVFALAAQGLHRFWKSLCAAGPREVRMGFARALFQAVAEILTHRNFKRCGENRPRYVAHVLLLYGFFGAMLTAGLAVVFTEITRTSELPLPPSNPIKIVGVVSGLAIIIGGTILIVRRMSAPDRVAANQYSDRLFLYVLFGAGTTGLLTWLTRIAGWHIAAIAIYFGHLVLVFFLLFYMPYSKFAHMLYRGLALVYARRMARTSADFGFGSVPTF